jgi:hypothetical protein
MAETRGMIISGICMIIIAAAVTMLISESGAAYLGAGAPGIQSVTNNFDYSGYSDQYVNMTQGMQNVINQPATATTDQSGASLTNPWYMAKIATQSVTITATMLSQTGNVLIFGLGAMTPNSNSSTSNSNTSAQSLILIIMACIGAAISIIILLEVVSMYFKYRM